MKRFLKWSGIAAFAALLPLLMAPSGGFPFFPTFGKVRIYNGATIAPATCSTTSLCVAQNNANATALIVANSVAGSSNGIFLQAGTNASDTAFNVKNQAGSTTFFSINGAGTFTGIPNTAYGVLNINGATCTSVTAPIRGISGTCTHTGTGTYQITFSPVFVAAPLCVTTVTGSLFFVTMSTIAGTALVTTWNTSFAVADSVGAVQIFCALG